MIYFENFEKKLSLGLKMAKPKKKLETQGKNSSSRRICPRPPFNLVFKKRLILKVLICLNVTMKPSVAARLRI